ncbi:MAG: acyl carrier protein, partial [bacterium]|nr:acyl carrier protein [bacterium]
TGIIDSADLVRFATFLERSFGFEVPDQDLNAEHFDTVAMSVEYVQAKTG